MKPQQKNLLYAQSGGVTAVINATAGAVLETAREARDAGQIGKVFAARNGILGALSEEIYDTSVESDEAVAALRYRPGGAFGSCRYKLPQPDAGDGASSDLYDRLFAVLEAHQIHHLLYNGGNDSQDTTNRITQAANARGYDLTCVGIPKTVDNDLAGTDCCPGFGSVAKYVATSIGEAALDVASMSETSTKVFILEVMGRNAGWIVAACGLAGASEDEAPHILLFPEKPFDEQDFLERVRAVSERHGYCVIGASEGVRDAAGNFLAEAGGKDAFGHAQLGGVAPRLAEMVQRQLQLKCHWAVADYLQRSARHLASATDVEHARAVGEAAVQFALQGDSGTLPVIVRGSDNPYRWHIEQAAVADSANLEKTLPPPYLSDSGYGISDACRTYLSPLVQGEDWPPYEHGLPQRTPLKLQLLPSKLPPWQRP